MKFLIKYSIELVVIVAGITLSFVVDEWREERQKRENEIEILKDLRYGLQEDHIDIERCNIRYAIQIDCIDSVLFLLENSEMDENITQLISKSFFTTVFQPHIGGYEDLKGRGISIIKNDSLLESMVTLFERAYKLPKLQEEYYIHDLQTRIMDYCLQNFDKYGIYKSDADNWFTYDNMVPNDYDILRHDHLFKSLLKTYRNFLTTQITVCKIVKDNISSTLISIDKELSKE